MNLKIGKYEIHLDFKLGKFPVFNLKPFFAGFIVVFLFSVLSHLGVKLPEFHFKKSLNINSYNYWTDNTDSSIIPKLKQKANSFKLLNSAKIIPATFTTADFENAQSFIVVDFNSGNVLLEKDSSRKLSIASLTKIMTAIVALDLASPSILFNTSLNAVSKVPTKIGLLVNEKMNLSELLYASLLTSANDAVEVLKEGIDSIYGTGTFVEAMNKKSQILGLKNTHFSNPQGFDSKFNYSSAKDLTVLSHFAITSYPLISEIAVKDYQYLPENKYHGFFDLYNWNGLLGVYPGVFGLKIGNTKLSGYTTIVLSEREGKKVLVVLLGAPGVLERDLWAAQLLDAGFEKLGLPSVNITEEQLRGKYGTWEYFN